MKKRTTLRDKVIGERIRFLRQVAGMTLEEVAKKLEISAQQMQKYETGINKISASRIEMLSEILNLPISIFFDDKKGWQYVDMLSEHLDKSAFKLLNSYTNISSEKLKKLLLICAETYANQPSTD